MSEQTFVSLNDVLLLWNTQQALQYDSGKAVAAWVKTIISNGAHLPPAPRPPR